MGVRLVYYNKMRNGDGTDVYGDHSELINCDIPNQHPIYAITGLQEVLNIIENLLNDHSYKLEEIDAIQGNITRIDLELNSIRQNIVNYIDSVLARAKLIEDFQDTTTIDLTYDPTNKILTADAIIYDDPEDENILQATPNGLFVCRPAFNDSNTIKWEHYVSGEDLAELFANGIRFSHNTSSWSNLFNPSETTSWYWDASVNSFRQPQNTPYYNGFITNHFYDNYTHRVRIVSTDGDDDVNGVIIGHMFDENGHPHTLSILIGRTGTNSSMTWALVYDYMLPDQTFLFRQGNGTGGSTPTGSGSGGWSRYGNGITVEVVKNGTYVSVRATAWNNTTEDFEEKTRITINLNNYSWGYLFKGFVRYGYSNYSQANTYYRQLLFEGTMSGQKDIYQAFAILSPDANNAIKERSNGLWAETFVISEAENNALVKNGDGYFVQKIRTSSAFGNGISLTNDGVLYCRSANDYKLVTQENHGFIVGDFIYHHPDKKYYKAIAKDDFDVNVVGMVTRIISTSQFEYMWSGYFSTTLFSANNGYAQGMPLYLSDIDPGKVVQKQPDISKSLGYPVENTGIIIVLERGIQYNNEAKIGDFKKSLNTYNVRSDGFIRVVDNVEYKRSLIQPLIDTVTSEFINSYIIFNDETGTVMFKNIAELREQNDCNDGVELFIKAF